MEDWQAISEPTSNTMPGEGAQEETFTTVGALLCLIGMQQFIDEIPGTGFAWSTTSPARGQLLGVMWKEHRYDVTIAPLSLPLGGTVKLVSTPMPV